MRLILKQNYFLKNLSIFFIFTAFALKYFWFFNRFHSCRFQLINEIFIFGLWILSLTLYKSAHSSFLTDWLCIAVSVNSVLNSSFLYLFNFFLLFSNLEILIIILILLQLCIFLIIDTLNWFLKCFSFAILIG